MFGAPPQNPHNIFWQGCLWQGCSSVSTPQKKTPERTLIIFLVLGIPLCPIPYSLLLQGILTSTSSYSCLSTFRGTHPTPTPPPPPPLLATNCRTRPFLMTVPTGRGEVGFCSTQPLSDPFPICPLTWHRLWRDITGSKRPIRTMSGLPLLYQSSEEVDGTAVPLIPNP